MRINNNLMAMNTHRQLGTANTDSAKSIEKLSSGYRINRAGDDAAGLSISEKMRGQIRGLTQASRNSQDGISLIQTAEGALGETHAILQRMRELAVQAGNDTNVEADRKEIQNEMNELRDEIDRIANNTEFNTQKLLDGGSTQVSGTGGSVAAEATAVVTGGAVADLDFATTSATIEINGESITIDTDHTGDMDALISDLQNKLDGAGVAVTVSANEDGDGIVLTSAADIEIGGANFAALGLEAGTVAAEAAEGVSGESFEATLQVGANNGQTFKINISDMRAEALGLTGTGGSVAAEATAVVTGGAVADLDFATTSATIEINGESITIDTDHTGDMDALISDLQNKLDGAGVAVTVSANEDGDGIVLTSAADIEIGGANFAALGLEAGTVAAEAAEGAASGIDVTDNAKANATIDVIDAAITKVSEQRSKLGAWQNRLEHTIKNLDTSSENLQAAEARIRDVDMAKEMMEQTKQNILAQASTAMLAQANQAPQAVLQLLR